MEITRTEFEWGAEWRNEQGELHREDGPAIEWPDDAFAWCLNNNYHRIGGPALVANGCQEWWQNGQRHNEDGPAFIGALGWTRWFHQGEWLDRDEEQFCKELKEMIFRTFGKMKDATNWPMRSARLMYSFDKRMDSIARQLVNMDAVMYMRYCHYKRDRSKS